MALDTLRSLADAVPVVLVISDQPALASRLARAGIARRGGSRTAAAGMNAALAYGAGQLRTAGLRHGAGLRR